MQLNLNFENSPEIPLNLINFDNKPRELDRLPAECVITDIETTGLNPARDSIIEISAIKIQDDKIVSEFSSLINPDISLPPFISNLTGIDDSMVKNARKLNEVMFDYCNFIGCLPVVGHNIKFDLSFINAKLKHLYNTSLKNDYADTLYFAKKAYPALQSYKLSSLAHNLNLDTKNAHRALFDCKMTYELFLDIKSKL